MIWKGKTKSATNNIRLDWPGKDDAVLAAQQATAARFQQVDKLSSGLDSNNLLIEGNNLDALKLLQEDFGGTIKGIYIDPPYNTSNEFVYKDSLSHEAWLTMMFPRLELARKLLTTDGAIFISIDDNEIDKLKLVMSEIFGEENFVAQITIQSNPRGRQAERHFARVHEYVLIYARDTLQCKFGGATLSPRESAEFSYTDANSRSYRLLGLRQRGADSLREDRPSMYFPIYVDPSSGAICLSKDSENAVAVLPKKSTGQDGRWMWSRQRVEQSLNMLEARLIRGRNEWDLFVRDYLDDEDGNDRTRKIKTIWDEKDLNYQNGKRQLKDVLGECPVDYPKPLALLRKVLSIMDDPSGTYLDFFAGSGTLGQAVLEQNAADGGTRKFVLVQLAESIEHAQYKTIADICRERILRCVRQQNEAGLPDVGFRYLRIC